MVSHGRNADITYRSLELDKRMGLVMLIRWASLAAGTEIGIVANSALVTVTLDVNLNCVTLVAERSVAVDTNVASLAAVGA
jgi:hypothetical protein